MTEGGAQSPPGLAPAGGMSPSRACSRCEAPTPAGARFCPACGQPLTGSEAGPMVEAGGPTRQWPIVWIGAAAAAVVVLAVVVVAVAIGFGRAAKSVTNSLTPKPGRPPGYRGPGYAGMLVQDRVAAGADASIDLSGQGLTAGALTPTAGLFGLGNTVCTTVTTVDNSATSVDVGPADWKLQAPNGTVETFQLNSTLQTGQIAPGGRATGTVCFADTGQAGTYELLWQPLFQVGRGVWLLQR